MDGGSWSQCCPHSAALRSTPLIARLPEPVLHGVAANLSGDAIRRLYSCNNVSRSSTGMTSIYGSCLPRCAQLASYAGLCTDIQYCRSAKQGIGVSGDESVQHTNRHQKAGAARTH